MPVDKGLNADSKVWQTFEVRYWAAKKFGERDTRVVSLLSRSQAAPQHNFRKRVFKFCIRFALTLLSRSQAAPQHNFRKRVFKFCIRFALTLLSRSQAAPQHNFAPETDEKTIFLIDSHSAFFDILIPQKVRQEGLSETHACRCCSIRQSMYVWDFSAFVWQTKNSSTEPTWVVQWNCMKFGNSQD